MKWILPFPLVLPWKTAGYFKLIHTMTDPLVVLSNHRPNSYDLLLLDIKMPAMNGFELYDKMKRIDNKVKVCFISAYDVEYAALGEQFPSLERDGIIPNKIIRKPIEVSNSLQE
jgi:two-component SAPR family response regulator